ncbi:MAG: thioesterase family protein, partial [Myxococcota bacterium]
MNPPSSFDDATRVEQVGETLFRADIPDGWQQGRGAFGGLVVGLCLRALDAVREDPSRRLRTASAQIPSPVRVGETLLEVTPLRRGSGVDAMEVHLRQDGEVRARATGIFGRPRSDDVVDLPTPPDLPPVTEPLPMPPQFAAHFEMRNTGPLPFGGGPEGLVEGWVKPRLPFVAMGAPEIACLCDVYWPAVFAQLTGFRPAATLGFMLQTTPEAFGRAPDEIFFFRSRQLHAADGFSHELRELWSDDGKLLALNNQTFAIIR